MEALDIEYKSLLILGYSRDIWLALAQVQQAQVLSQVLAAVSVPLVVAMGVVDSSHAVDLLVDPAKLLVTSAEVCVPKFFWEPIS